MKKLLLLLALIGCLSGAASFAQTAAATAPAAVVATSAAQFDPIYWASKPNPVAALATMKVDFQAPTASGRTSTALALATKGYTIDGPVMVWGFDAYLMMQYRQQLGYTWVPSLLQPSIEDAPGFAPYGTTLAYQPNAPPPGSITVTLALSAYPPANPPAPAKVFANTVTFTGSCVGRALGAGYYAAPYYANTPACALPNGQTYTADPRGAFIFGLAATPFGTDVWFKSQSGN